ncbi:hypothetical protein ACHAXR_006275 [Thalassiosira sp. AJA248-18]
MMEATDQQPLPTPLQEGIREQNMALNTKRHGEWMVEEHHLFLQGLEQYGNRRYGDIATLVKSRTPDQIRCHAQKHWQKLTKEKHNIKTVVQKQKKMVKTVVQKKKQKNENGVTTVTPPAVGEMFYI